MALNALPTTFFADTLTVMVSKGAVCRVKQIIIAHVLAGRGGTDISICRGGTNNFAEPLPIIFFSHVRGDFRFRRRDPRPLPATQPSEHAALAAAEDTHPRSQERRRAQRHFLAIASPANTHTFATFYLLSPLLTVCLFAMRVPAVAWAGGVVAAHLQRGADAFVVRSSGMSLVSRVDSQKYGANDVFFMCRKPGDSPGCCTYAPRQTLTWTRLHLLGAAGSALQRSSDTPHIRLAYQSSHQALSQTND